MSPLREIGPFQVLEKLGAGGMGEVFKARDTRLNRFVAIKLLPGTANSTARERFQREALAIAALNHPNICTLYEAGEHQGQPFLVMELLEGETLHSRLVRGPVTANQSALWGGEIADALQAAHAKGILHRDLKPGNIFLTQRGIVKVLDFGLAQFTAAPASDENAATVTAAASPPVSPLTNPGTALGTYAYMAPEQARGEPTDARSDIFSLGVVLYEMAGGRPPFRGRTSADLMAAILMLTPPAPSTLRPEIPARLDDVIAQCLEKDPDLRFQTATELRVSLRRLQGASSSGPPSSSASVAAVVPAPPSRRFSWLRPAIAAAIVVVAAGTWWALRSRTPSAPDLQFRQLTFSGQVQDVAISPDGKFLAHLDRGPQGTTLHLMAIANGSDTQIAPGGPGCCEAPSFSPDGNTVYFVQNRVLKSVPVLGGAVRDIANNVCSGAAFSPDGRQIAYITPTGTGSALTLAASDGTQPRVLNDPGPSAGFNSDCWLAGPLQPDTPAWSPDSHWIAVQTSGAGNDLTDQVVLVSPQGRTSVLGGVMDLSASALAWLPDGSGLVLATSIPTTAPPQLYELTYPEGKLLTLTHDLQGYNRVSIAAQAAGAMVMVHSNPQYSLYRQPHVNGAFVPLPGGGANQDGSTGVAWTPSGQLVSVHALAGRSQLWLEDGDAPAQQLPIANLPELVRNPRVAPNGQIVFQGINAGGFWRIYRTDPDGASLTLLTGSFNAIQPALVLDNRIIAFENLAAEGNHQQVWTVPLAGGAARALSRREVYINFLLPAPDQRSVLAIVVRPGNVVGAVMRFGLDGSDPVEVHPREFHARFGGPYALTPDGRALTSVIAAGSVGNIWAAPLDGSPLYQITHFTDLSLVAYAFAPDGRLAVSRGSQNSDAVLATSLAGKH